MYRVIGTCSQCGGKVVIPDVWGGIIPPIREWAEARNLIAGSDSFRQLAKLVEETGELAADISRGRPRRCIADSIGDCVVVLTILAAQNSLQIEDCIAQAYDEIKDRRGVMKDGVFVKEEDVQ